MNPNQVIKRPVVSEKSSASAEAENKYVFEVNTRANKNQVKEAVGKLFGVEVLRVWTSVIHGKKVRLGKMRKFKTGSNWKRAVVEVEKGKKIELFEAKSK